MQGTVLKQSDITLTARLHDGGAELISVPVTLRMLGRRRYIVKIHIPTYIHMSNPTFRMYTTKKEAEAQYAWVLLHSDE